MKWKPYDSQPQALAGSELGPGRELRKTAPLPETAGGGRAQARVQQLWVGNQSACGRGRVGRGGCGFCQVEPCCNCLTQFTPSHRLCRPTPWPTHTSVHISSLCMYMFTLLQARWPCDETSESYLGAKVVNLHARWYFDRTCTFWRNMNHALVQGFLTHSMLMLVSENITTKKETFWFYSEFPIHPRHVNPFIFLNSAQIEHWCN